MDGARDGSASSQLASLLEEIYQSTLPSPTPGGIQQQVACHVGWLIGIQQQELQSTASLLAPDNFVRRVGGIPLHTLLLAVPPKESEVVEIAGNKIYAPGVLLVRPVGTLTDMQKSAADTLFQHYRQNPYPGPTQHTSQQAPGVFGLGLDAYTKHAQSYGGFCCQALGTLYSTTGPDGQPVLRFSPDIEYAPFDCGYTVIKPPNHMVSQILREISGRPDAATRIRLGQVLYSATQNLQRQDASAMEAKGDIEIGLDLDEILARRTALFGMTRTGKSNTVKVLATNIAAQRPEVGHLIFDVNGEYAHANQRDNGSLALALAPTGRVDILSSMKVAKGQGLTLLPNFFVDMNLGLQLALASIATRPTSEAFGTLSKMKFVEFPEGDLRSWHNPQNEAMKALMFRCLLHTAGYSGMDARQIIALTTSQWREVRKSAGWDRYDVLVSKITSKSMMSAAELAKRDHDVEVDALGQLILGSNSGNTSITGLGHIGGARDYHSEQGPADGLDRFLCQALDRGRLVILDLSLTPPSAQSTLMEYIASRLFREATTRFTQWLENEGSEKQVCSWMVYIEEAHNLIGPQAKPDDPWPRLAKEGGKMGIGMVFATQEPSGIQTNIMSNTDNFLVSHLNNKREVREISEYGDLATFSGSIIRVRTPGYIRLRQRDLPFSLPVQVDMFSMEWAREILQRHGCLQAAVHQDHAPSQDSTEVSTLQPLESPPLAPISRPPAATAPPASPPQQEPSDAASPQAPSARPRRFGVPKDTKE